ncbi:hypothetical protein [Mycoplasma sp. 1018B]|uniref:hypothetical protein n=1 Tax=Mycoplasma sp. 1018B TaxID=2967302 RepID=UPI00211CB024|nr:hypothetical protein [Mycoplasma sp. 1018B]UUM19339.1 hypothetical protein NPA14_00475 [Mycoplasma sp. 1018B]
MKKSKLVGSAFALLTGASVVAVPLTTISATNNETQNLEIVKYFLNGDNFEVQKKQLIDSFEKKIADLKTKYPNIINWGKEWSDKQNQILSTYSQIMKQQVQQNQFAAAFQLYDIVNQGLASFKTQEQYLTQIGELLKSFPDSVKFVEQVQSQLNGQNFAPSQLLANYIEVVKQHSDYLKRTNETKQTEWNKKQANWDKKVQELRDYIVKDQQNASKTFVTVLSSITNVLTEIKNKYEIPTRWLSANYLQKMLERQNYLVEEIGKQYEAKEHILAIYQIENLRQLVDELAFELTSVNWLSKFLNNATTELQTHLKSKAQQIYQTAVQAKKTKLEEINKINETDSEEVKKMKQEAVSQAHPSVSELLNQYYVESFSFLNKEIQDLKEAGNNPAALRKEIADEVNKLLAAKGLNEYLITEENPTAQVFNEHLSKALDKLVENNSQNNSSASDSTTDKWKTILIAVSAISTAAVVAMIIAIVVYLARKKQTK